MGIYSFPIKILEDSIDFPLKNRNPFISYWNLIGIYYRFLGRRRDGVSLGGRGRDVVSLGGRRRDGVSLGKDLIGIYFIYH